jgi:hypothetical protein
MKRRPDCYSISKDGKAIEVWTGKDVVVLHESDIQKIAIVATGMGGRLTAVSLFAAGVTMLMKYPEELKKRVKALAKVAGV